VPHSRRIASVARCGSGKARLHMKLRVLAGGLASPGTVAPAQDYGLGRRSRRRRRCQEPWGCQPLDAARGSCPRDLAEDPLFRADKVSVSAFLRQAEDVLDTAIGGGGDQDVVIVIGRQGGIRLIDPAGWTLPALSAEYGATAVYRVERRRDATRVEGLCGSERCLLQRKNPHSKPWGLGMPGMPGCPAPAAQTMLLHALASAAA
jgi:hypothetical protein